MAKAVNGILPTTLYTFNLYSKISFLLTEEILTPMQQLNEYIMTSLRTMEGMNLNFVQEKFGEKYSAEITKAVMKWIDGKKVIIDEIQINFNQRR